MQERGRRHHFMLRLIKRDIGRIFTSYEIYVCIFSVTLLGLLAPCFWDVRNDTHSMFATIFEMTKSDMRQGDINLFSSVRNISRGREGMLGVFGPITVAFVFASKMCDELKFQTKRYDIFRVGRFRYFAAKYLGYTIIGGAALAFGYLLYSLVVIICFPSASSFSMEAVEQLTSLGINSSLSSVIYESVLSVFCYGVFVSALTMLFSAFFTNKYVLLCIPFFILYMVDSVSMVILDRMKYDVNEKVARIICIVNPKYDLLHIETALTDICYIILLYVGIYVCFFAVYYFIQRRRIDSGA